MFSLNVLEHIAADRVDTVQLSIRANDVHHAGLQLISFVAFIVEIVHVECGVDRQRK